MGGSAFIHCIGAAIALVFVAVGSMSDADDSGANAPSDFGTHHLASTESSSRYESNLGFSD